MESAIKTVVSVFLKSSKGKENIGQKDFQSLVKNQMKNVLTDTDSSDAVKEMSQGLDSDKDGKVSFQEYMKLVGYLASSISAGRFNEKATEVQASSGNDTQAEVPTGTKLEPKDDKQELPEKLEVAAKVEEEEEEKAEEEEKVEEEAETGAAS